MFWCHLNSDSRWNGGSIVYPVKYWISGFHLQDIKPRKEPLDKNKSSRPLMINQRKTNPRMFWKFTFFFLPLHFTKCYGWNKRASASPQLRTYSQSCYCWKIKVLFKMHIASTQVLGLISEFSTIIYRIFFFFLFIYLLPYSHSQQKWKAILSMHMPSPGVFFSFPGRKQLFDPTKGYMNYVSV